MTASRTFSWRVWALAAAFFVLSTWLYTRHNTFPYFYHPDEPNKAQQVLTGQRNFRHPLLLVNTTDLAMRLLNVERTRQKAVLAGRWSSAIFAAVAVSALALLAYRQRGMVAMICVGVIVMTHFQIFELSHYVKEDPALLMGLALFFLALDFFWESQTPVRTLALGAAAGLAFSAKYVGFVALVIGLSMAASAGVRARAPKWWRLPALCFLGFLLVALPINLQGWFNPSFWARGFETEMSALGRGYYEFYEAFSWRPFHMLQRLVFWQIAVFATVYVFFFLRDRTLRTAPGWILILFPLFYTAALAVIGRDNGRYFLPVIAIINYHCGLGIAELSKRLVTWTGVQSRVAVVVCAFAGVGTVLKVELPTLANFHDAFLNDHRQQLADYVERELPAQASIAAEHSTGLVRPEPEGVVRTTRKVRGSHVLPELGTLDDLRGQGITHVAISDLYRRPFFLSERDSRQGIKNERTESHRLFYEQLFAEGKLLFETRGGKVRTINARLRLYEIAPVKGPAAAGP